jgi:hypothetical protein
MESSNTLEHIQGPEKERLGLVWLPILNSQSERLIT